MANINIEKKENNNKYHLYCPDNNALNIITTNDVNGRYREMNALETIQNIANQAIAPDAAYWQKLEIIVPTDLPFMKMANYNKFIIIMDRSSTVSRISIDYGKSWKTRTLDAFEIESGNPAKKLCCAPTYCGYKIQGYKSSLADDLYFDALVGFNGKVINDTNIESCDKLIQDVVKTPFGFAYLIDDSTSTTNRSRLELKRYTLNTASITNNRNDSWSIQNIGYINHGYVMSTVHFAYDERANRFLCAGLNPTTNKYSVSLIKSHVFTRETPISNIPIDTALDMSRAYQIQCSANALGRAWFLYTDNTYWYVSYLKSTETVRNMETLNTPHIEGDWQWMFGNNYRLYIVSTEGDIAYLDQVNGDWHIADQSVEMDGNGYKSFKSYCPLGLNFFEAVTDNENTYIIANVNGEHLLRTSVYNLK